MKVIDARSGKELLIGQRVDWGSGEGIMLLDVSEGFFSAAARVRITTDNGRGLVTQEMDSPLVVRYLHPKFLLQRVGFLPS